jgi:enoyl-CoA hydratase
VTGTADPILAERQGEILLLTINRPQRRNAFDRALAEAMSSALDEYEADDGLRVAILTGAGATFSAGQDLLSLPEEGVAATYYRGIFGILERPPEKPLIAAVEGHALGGGLELCLACDLIVAARTATMGLPEARHGLLALGGGVFRLPRRIPYHLAMELCLTGRAVPATELHQLGLVNRLVDQGEAVGAALELAGEVARCGPLAVRASKQVIRQAYDWAEADAWERQREFTEPVLDSDDAREGLAAFAERRPPMWRGR